MSDNNLNNDKQHAEDLCQNALTLLHSGKIHEAVELLKSSIMLHPTAKAHTHLGWAYSREGKFDLAIKECFIALEIDPDLGSIYNHIGAYLVQKGLILESEEWFRKAISARVYDARHFAFTNLARVVQSKGNWFEALQLYDTALRYREDYSPARTSRILLQALMN